MQQAALYIYSVFEEPRPPLRSPTRLLYAGILCAEHFMSMQILSVHMWDKPIPVVVKLPINISVAFCEIYIVLHIMLKHTWW